MGGSISGLYKNTVGSKSGKDWATSFFSGEQSKDYSATKNGIGSLQSESVSSYKSDLIAEEINQDEKTIYILSLFIAMYYFLKGKFGNVKNRKLVYFLHKINEIISNDNESLINCSEFKKFMDFCKNKNVHLYSGYEIVRRFMTKYFFDSSGIFMRLRTDEWERYFNHFSRNNN